MRARESVRVHLQRFLRDPNTVGAIAPSSRRLARRMMHGVEWRPGVRIVEFGPGTGPFTEAILARLPAGGRYLGIDRDEVFIEALRRRFPSLEFVHDSVANLKGIADARTLLPVDHVVSGLPFASLPGEVTEATLQALHGALRRGGTFTTFQYVHAVGFAAARRFRDRMLRLFGPMEHWSLELLNVPPAFAFTWRKSGDRGRAKGDR